MSENLAIKHLRRLGACHDAVEWVGDRTPYQAWRQCERGDWLLWIAARAGVDRRVLATAACAVARTALVHVPDGEPRPLAAIEAAEGWARGEVSINEVRRRRNAAADAARAAGAAYAAYAARAAYAAYAAAYAADAAGAAYAADAAARATYVASAATDAARATYVASAATDAARADSLHESARIVRRLIPWRMVRDAMKNHA